MCLFMPRTCYTCAAVRALLLFCGCQQQHHVPEGKQGGQKTHLRVQPVYIQGGCTVWIVRVQE